MNQQRRLSYMKALGIPIWLCRTDDADPAHSDEPAYNEQIYDEQAYDEQVAMQQYEQQYDQYQATAPTTAIDSDYALNLIESLNTQSDKSQHKSPNRDKLSKNVSQLLTTEKYATQTTSAQSNQTKVQSQTALNKTSTKHPSLHKSTDKPNQSSDKQTLELLNWQDLHNVVKQCQYCEMARFRSNTVFGSGNTEAKWLFIGEAPDVEDDQQGLPFLAKSGQLLDNILAAINLDRNSVYLTNILKCRPPNDRDPHVDEAKQCMGYLHRQIELIQPKVIVVVGRVATRHLLQIKKPLGKMRGYVHYLEKSRIPVVVTYHPRYLLRQPSAKRKLWEDIKLAQSIVQASL
jgi:DNA polymerase